MKIERLRNKKSKLIFLCGFLIVVVLLITLVFKGSKAKYRNSNIIPLINTKVKNNVPSFTTMGIYLNDGGPITGADGKKYTKQGNTYTMPSSGYVINETNSYCEKFNSATNTSVKDTNVKLYTNILGKHSIEGVSSGDKCHLFFDTATDKPLNAGTFLLLSWGYKDLIGMTEITERPESDFTGTTKVVKTDTGNKLFKAPDDDGWSYYFVGRPSNNWVKFGGHYWRIVRINGDGTIRMIYSGTSTPAEFGYGTQLSKYEVADISDIRTYPYNKDNYSNAVYVGYKFTEGQLHGTTEKSSIYNIVNSFYVNGITSNDKKYIDKNAGFCNDRTLAADNPVGSTGYGTTATNFAPRQRILGSPMTRPILTCPDKINDLFTAVGATKGNKSLDNPIGLITVDEVSLAGLLYEPYGATSGNYFYTGKHYWTMSPSNITSTGKIARVWFVYDGGHLQNNTVSLTSVGVRPVINLVKDIKFSKGNGSISSPFEI